MMYESNDHLRTLRLNNMAHLAYCLKHVHEGALELDEATLSRGARCRRAGSVGPRGEGEERGEVDDETGCDCGLPEVWARDEMQDHREEGEGARGARP